MKLYHTTAATAPQTPLGICVGVPSPTVLALTSLYIEFTLLHLLRISYSEARRRRIRILALE